MAWTEEARQAALAARAAKSGAKQQQPGRKRGPQTAAHPNAGSRAAFALRNKMQHDAGRADRMAAAHQAGVIQVGKSFMRLGGGFVAGLAQAALNTAKGRGMGGGGGRR